MQAAAVIWLRGKILLLRKNVMLVTQKSLRGADPSKLCLTIPLGGGAKVQYAVSSMAEAAKLYREHVACNAAPDAVVSPSLRLIRSQTYSTYPEAV